MKRSLVYLLIATALAMPAFASAHETDSQNGVLGKVTFPTS